MVSLMGEIEGGGCKNNDYTVRGDMPAYIRNTPNRVFSIGALSDAARPCASMVRVVRGSMMPSSHNREVA
jgi:hypothetical protein